MKIGQPFQEEFEKIKNGGNIGGARGIELQILKLMWLMFRLSSSCGPNFIKNVPYGAMGEEEEQQEWKNNNNNSFCKRNSCIGIIYIWPAMHNDIFINFSSISRDS